MGLNTHKMTHKTDWNIGADEAKQLGEVLKANTTLTKLNLWGEKRKKEEKKGCEKKETQMIGGNIGDEGAKGLSEGLKVNTTLTELNLKSEEERKRERKREWENE